MTCILSTYLVGEKYVYIYDSEKKHCAPYEKVIKLMELM